MTEITSQARREARIHAVSEYPKESCGFFVDVEGDVVYVPATNVSDKPLEDFTISGRDYAEAEDLGTIMAVVHSHPDASPALSPADRRALEARSLPWYVLGVERGADGLPGVTETEWHAPTGQKYPLLRRPFVHGHLDCFSLIQDHYDQELGITIQDFPREPEWWNKGFNLYVEQFEKAGFREIDRRDIMTHDVILMQIRSPVTNHGAVYIGNHSIMHHLFERLSNREFLSDYFLDRATHFLRHESR